MPKSYPALTSSASKHRALSKTTDGDEKTWILAGNLFVKTRTETAKLLIARGEHACDSGYECRRDSEKTSGKDMHTGLHSHVKNRR